MKRILCVLVLACWIMGTAVAVPVIHKQDLKVLYVGYRPDMPLPEWATYRIEADRQTDYKERMPAFEKLLGKYFTTVKTVDARDYTQAMSGDYDVTVFDALPRPLKMPVLVRDSVFGFTVSQEPGVYLTADFDRPALFVGYVSDEIGRSLGLKLDWYCLCLFWHALNIRTEHPVFHRPFDVRLTLENRPTPEDFYNYNQDWVLPREIPMWRVVRDSSRIGMVSGWYGLSEGNDAEFISGGHCMKSYENMAIGRHGNFFLWGFGAAPDRMTAEAQTVFANSVDYISRFAGHKPVVRKFNYPVLRDKIRDFLTVLTPEGYQIYLKGVDTYNCWLVKKQEDLRRSGKTLSAEEQKFMERGPMKPWSHLEYVKKNSQFGLIYDYQMDIEAVRNFLTENMDYFNCGHLSEGKLFVDEEVKELGIPNWDIRLLDTCVKMLETQRQPEKALRILKRYTNQQFNDTAQWRSWLDTCRGKLFFTELGDYKFMGDGSECINYAIREKEKEERPVVVSVDLVDNGKEQEIKVCFKIQSGYHIYASGGKDCPLVLTNVAFTFPEGVRKIGELQKPASRKYAGDSEVRIYKGEVVFAQKISIQNPGNAAMQIKCIVDYQCCNADICLSPEKETHTITL